jgi:hypothetical protein
MKRLTLLLGLLLTLSVGAMAISVNPGILYQAGTGSQAPNVIAVGIPLQVHKNFYFEDLGVYKLNSGTLWPAGISEPEPKVNVFLAQWNGSLLSTPFTAVPNSPVGITNSSPYVSTGSSSWAEVNSGSGLTLTPGWYVLWATLILNPYDTASVPSFRPFYSNPTVSGYNTFGGAVSYGYHSGGNWYQLVGTFSGGNIVYSWQAGSVPIFISGGNISVPEPSTYALMASVGLALYLLRRRKSRAANQ